MAISLIQKNTLYDTATATVNLPVAFSSNVRAGDLIIVAVCAFTATVSSVTDSQSNTYTQVTNSPAVNGSDRSYLYYAKNVKGGAVTVTVNFSAGSRVRSIGIYEYMGADPTAPFDKSATAGSGTGTTVAPGAVTPTNNNSLIVSVGGDFVGGGTGAITPQTGYTLEDSQTDNVSHERYYFEDFIQGTAASTTAQFTVANSAAYRVIASVFKPATFAAVSTLSDTFTGTTIDPTKWTQFTAVSGTIAQSDTLNATPAATTSGSWGGVYSVNRYNLVGSNCFVQQVAIGAGNTFLDLTLSIETLPSNNFFSIGVDVGTMMLQAGDEINGTFTTRSQVAYDASAHRWLQIRESGGTVFFEYSPSGLPGSWVTLDSRAPALNITAVYVVLDDFEYNALGTPGTSSVDNFNVAPSTIKYMVYRPPFLT